MKQLCLFFLLFIFSFFIKAQSWCPPGATWHFRIYDAFNAMDGVAKYQFIGTNVINGISCKKINATYNGTGFQGSITINNYDTYYTYENNRVIYLYNSYKNVFDTVVNFNANIGDKWLILNRTASMCDSNATRSSRVVTDTGHVLINNTWLKTVSASATITNYSGPGPSTYSLVYHNAFVEKILDTTGFLFPVNCTFIDNISKGNFKCYSDDNFPLYKKSGVTNCDYVPTTIIEQTVLNENIRVYPNPAANNITIENLNGRAGIKITLLNLLGQAIYVNDEAKNKCEINISALTPAIYFLKIEGSGFGKMLKIVKD